MNTFINVSIVAEASQLSHKNRLETYFCWTFSLYPDGPKKLKRVINFVVSRFSNSYSSITIVLISSIKVSIQKCTLVMKDPKKIPFVKLLFGNEVVSTFLNSLFLVIKHYLQHVCYLYLQEWFLSSLCESKASHLWWKISLDSHFFEPIF